MYIALIGIDGAGKSTAATAIKDWLAVYTSTATVNVREVGTTNLAEQIRNFMFHRPDLNKTARCEMLLASAARESTLEDEVKPAIADGLNVFSDRCHVCTFAYQGVSDELKAMYYQIHSGMKLPDVVVMLDLDPDVANERLDNRDKERDTMELRGIQFQKEVRERYLEAIQGNPFAIRIPAEGSREEVYQRVSEALTEHLLKPVAAAMFIHGDELTVREGPMVHRVPVALIEAWLMQHGYLITRTSNRLWSVYLDWGTIRPDVLAEELLNHEQAIKVAFADAIKKGTWKWDC